MVKYLKKLTKFELEKIYLDSVDNYGNCFIIYWAKLKFLFLNFTYSSLIYSNDLNNYSEKNSFLKINKPNIDEITNIYFPDFNFLGEWSINKQLNKKLKKNLYSIDFTNTNKIINWHCHHQLSEVKIKYNSLNFTGLGYIESILMTLQPWELPIEELRWGRFLHEDYSIIWIYWKGENLKNLIFVNGIEYNDIEFGNNCLYFNNYTMQLFFENPVNFKHNNFLDVIGKNFLLKKIMKNKFLESVESKFKSKSFLFINNEVKASGWSIYEVVNWSN